jgi:hypothetical protein
MPFHDSRCLFPGRSESSTCLASAALPEQVGLIGGRQLFRAKGLVSQPTVKPCKRIPTLNGFDSMEEVYDP